MVLGFMRVWGLAFSVSGFVSLAIPSSARFQRLFSRQLQGYSEACYIQDSKRTGFTVLFSIKHKPEHNPKPIDPKP